MRKNALSEHQAPLGGPEGRNAGKAREFHEIIVIILYKTISYNTMSNPKSYSFESDKVELGREPVMEENGELGKRLFPVSCRHDDGEVGVFKAR